MLRKLNDTNSFFDDEDLNFLTGMKEIKFLNVTGKLVIDDLGFTLTEFPSNNTVYTFLVNYQTRMLIK